MSRDVSELPTVFIGYSTIAKLVFHFKKMQKIQQKYRLTRIIAWAHFI